MNSSFSLKIATLFYIPSLRRLCLDNLRSLGPAMFQIEDWPVPHSAWNIQSLGLRDLQYTTTCATRMIRSCKALDSCEIQLDRRGVIDLLNEQWIEVLTALQDHSNTLTQLALRDELKFVTQRFSLAQSSSRQRLLRAPRSRRSRGTMDRDYGKTWNFCRTLPSRFNCWLISGGLGRSSTHEQQNSTEAAHADMRNRVMA